MTMLGERPVMIDPRSPAAVLDRAVADAVRSGYVVEARTATTAQLVKRKRFSLVWFLLVSLTGVGLIVYPFYHIFLKRDRSLYLEVDAQARVRRTERAA